MKQTAVEWLVDNLSGHDLLNTRTDNSIRNLNNMIKIEELIDQAKEMEKEQMKDAFVECWKSNVPDGIECKLDAEQYYNETFKSE